MAISTFMGLETTLRGLLASQQALDTTGHNIANANTPGYTRQTAVLQATDAFTSPGLTTQQQPGQLGTGVTVTQYQRVRDAYIDIQLRAQTMRQGAAQAQSDGLSQVELSLNEPSDNGLNSLLNKYWAAWQDVTNAPDDMATRQSLVQSAASLATGFNTLSSQLQTVSSQTSDEVTATIGDVNSIGGQIATLNDSIMREELAGNSPNDLLDQRDLLLDQLSAIGNTTITGGALGSVDVTIGGAQLVSGASAQTVAQTDLTSLTSGKLKGLADLLDPSKTTSIPAYQAQLDAVAVALKNATNAQHALGVDLNGNAGGAFFTSSTTGAADIAVNPALLANPALVAASASGQVGDGGNALAIADLQGSPLVGNATVNGAYSQLVTKIGSDAQQANVTLSNATALTGSLQNRRDSISGVSLDEEMTNLLKFQRGYQASARAMSAIDSMLDTLISRTGRAGL